jgi:hypothetical protein
MIDDGGYRSGFVDVRVNRQEYLGVIDDARHFAIRSFVTVVLGTPLTED